jgi:ArsR family transcriptional regulator
MVDRIYGLAYIYAMHTSPSQLFQLLSDETRLRCLLLMQREGELCVCELTHALDLSQPKVSRHLATLRDGGLVLDRRQGQWVYYRLHPELPEWAVRVLAEVAAGVSGHSPYGEDQVALARMPNRPGAACCA